MIRTFTQIKQLQDLKIESEEYDKMLAFVLEILFDFIDQTPKVVKTTRYERIYSDDNTSYIDRMLISAEEFQNCPRKSRIVKWSKIEGSKFIESDKKVNPRNNEDYELTPSSI